MNKILAGLFFYLVSAYVIAEGYSGAGIGYSEACRTRSSPGFSGGDCIDPNIDIRGLVGAELNDYFSVEASLDGSFDGGDLINGFLNEVLSDSNTELYVDDYSETNHWSIITLAASAFVHLPITDSVRLFAGPSVGGSLVSFDYDVKYFGNTESLSRSATESGLNYGWAAGIDVMRNRSGFMRLQWQNWHSLDADVAMNGEFNTNTFTLNMISYF